MRETHLCLYRIDCIRLCVMRTISATHFVFLSVNRLRLHDQHSQFFSLSETVTTSRLILRSFSEIQQVFSPQSNLKEIIVYT